jgi:DNA-binding MarR family transcriptional regulator
VLSILRTAGAPYELRPTDIRNQLLLTSGGIANIVNRLERMRLVERIPDQADGRSSWVRLTVDGIAVAEETIRAWTTVQERMFGDMDPQLARQVSDGLRRILVALGDQEPAAPVARQAVRS